MTSSASALLPPKGIRARLEDAVLSCLRDHGLAGTTSRRITERAGSNLASITYHYGSKDALVARALIGAVREWLEPALRALREGSDPAARTVAAMAALRAAFDDATPLLPAYYEAVLAPGENTVRAEVASLLAELRGFLSSQIAELRSRGYIQPWVEPEAMAALYLAAADGVALHRAIGVDSGVSPDAIAAQMAQLLFAARPG